MGCDCAEVQRLCFCGFAARLAGGRIAIAIKVREPSEQGRERET